MPTETEELEFSFYLILVNFNASGHFRLVTKALASTGLQAEVSLCDTEEPRGGVL